MKYGLGSSPNNEIDTVQVKDSNEYSESSQSDDKSVVSTTESLVKSNISVTADVEPVITQIEPVITPIGPVIIPIEPVITPIEPVITPIEPVITPIEPVITTIEPIINVESVVTSNETAVPTEIDNIDADTSTKHIAANTESKVADPTYHVQDCASISLLESCEKIEEIVVSENKDDCVTAMICDVVEVTGSIITEQPTNEMITSDEEIDLEMEVCSQQEPLTPQNDIDMSENSFAQDAFVKSTITYHFKNAPLVELSRYSWGGNEQKYLRGCIFSPDGTCILTTVNRDGMHIVELPLSLYDNETVTPNRPLDILTSAVHIKEAGTVYDYCWYPFMNSTMPDTCCFISSRQHEPIHLFDAFDGNLRCSYRGYDAVDEVDAALSVCFSVDGSQVIAGYKKSLKIFNTDVPGRDYTNFSLKSPATCLAVHSSDQNMIAIGSWNSNVTLHDVRTPKLTVIDRLVKHTGGVTVMKFSSDGKRLITGARRDNKLLGWDIRNVTQPLFNLNRNVETNQKIYFDMSWSDNWLISGDTKGIVHAFDMKCGAESGKFPDYQYTLHHDCCNGVSLHPSRPILATSSGQHHFIGIDNEIALKSSAVQENSLIFWWCGNPD